MTISSKTLRDRLPNPREIMAELDKYIIGQSHAKKTLSLMLLNRGLLHLVRKGIIKVNSPIEKSNVLLLGPTGTGKTALIKALSEITGIGIAIYDVTSISTGGYIGNKVEDILIRHVEVCEKYVEMHYPAFTEDSQIMSPFQKMSTLTEIIETGIIYLDEIDKLRIKADSNSGFGDGVQCELLKILESGDINLQTKNINAELPKSGVKRVITDNILYICGGAFSGLDDIIGRRLNKNNGIGFNAELKKDKKEVSDSLLKYVSTQDLIDYGLKPELLGRLPLKAVLDPLDVDTLIKIIEVPKGSVLSQYREIFNVFGVDLVIEKEAMKEVANLAMKLNTGARSLKAIFSNILQDEMINLFEYTKEQFVITPDLVKQRGEGNEEN